MSKSKGRRPAAIGNSAVIPAQAGIQCLLRRSRAANDDSRVIPVARSADRDPSDSRELGPGLCRGDRR
jgi:hypothetical protein